MLRGEAPIQVDRRIRSGWDMSDDDVSAAGALYQTFWESLSNPGKAGEVDFDIVGSYSLS